MDPDQINADLKHCLHDMVDGYRYLNKRKDITFKKKRMGKT
jgi:hypothetical protein